MFIEAIYEDGVLRPIVQHHLKEHRRYRFMLVEEMPTSELSINTHIDGILKKRSIILSDGRTMINVLGVFAKDAPNLDYEQIEQTLKEFCCIPTDV